MNRKETLAILAVIRAAFPAFYRDSNSNDVTAIWEEALEKDKAEHIAKALKDFIKTDASGFPPTIGQIRNLAKEYRYQDFIKSQEVEELPPPRTEEKIKEQDKMREATRRILSSR